jgi:hypothetical protein
MKFQKERRFLRSLCKGHINDLITDVGWSKTQCDIVRKHYIEFKSKVRTCMEIGLSETQYTREINNVLIKLISYLAYNKDTDISKIYYKYF